MTYLLYTYIMTDFSNALIEFDQLFQSQQTLMTLADFGSVWTGIESTSSAQHPLHSLPGIGEGLRGSCHTDLPCPRGGLAVIGEEMCDCFSILPIMLHFSSAQPAYSLMSSPEPARMPKIRLIRIGPLKKLQNSLNLKTATFPKPW